MDRLTDELLGNLTVDVMNSRVSSQCSRAIPYWQNQNKNQTAHKTYQLYSKYLSLQVQPFIVVDTVIKQVRKKLSH